MLMTYTTFGVGSTAAAMAMVVHGRFPYVTSQAVGTSMLDEIYHRGVMYKA